MPPDVRRGPEPIRMDSMSAPKSKSEIQARLDRIDEVVDNLGPNDKKSKELMFERAGLVDELKFAKDAAPTPQRETNVRPIESAIPQKEKKERDPQQELNLVLAEQLKKLLEFPNESSGLVSMAVRLKNPENLLKFVQGKLSDDYFKREVNPRDPKALKIAGDALDAIYNAANASQEKAA